MPANVQQGTTRHRVLASVAIGLLAVSIAGIFFGGLTTLFAFSPANIGDAGYLIRGGPTMLLGGAFGISKARRIFATFARTESL